jgi:hypothetical protein
MWKKRTQPCNGAERDNYARNGLRGRASHGEATWHGIKWARCHRAARIGWGERSEPQHLHLFSAWTHLHLLPNYRAFIWIILPALLGFALLTPTLYVVFYRQRR